MFLSFIVYSHAQLRLAPALTTNGALRLSLEGANTNTAYCLLHSPTLAPGTNGWAGWSTGGVGQTLFELPMPGGQAGFFRAEAVSVQFFPAAASGLPFISLGGMSSNGLSSHAATSLPIEPSSAVETRLFRGAFTPSSASTRLAVQSDDGSDVFINGTRVVGNKGGPTHWQDPASSLTFINYAFSVGLEYCVEIDFRNTAHTAGDIDGVSLYAYNGGGAVRDGIAVWPTLGQNSLCVGNGMQLGACGDAPFTWTFSPAGLVSATPEGAAYIWITGGATGVVTITARDGNGKAGARQITVTRPEISPNPFTNCVGVAGVFTFNSANSVDPIAWNPPGQISGGGRGNTLAFSTPGTVTVSAQQGGCSASATGVVVGVGSLLADVPALCREGLISYTARTVPPGHERLLTWNITGTMAPGYVATSYSSPGPKIVTVTCGTSALSITSHVYRMEITPRSQTVLAGSVTPAVFTLTNSHGQAQWSVAPAAGATFSGPSVGDTVAVVGTGASTNCQIIAVASAMPSCSDTARLEVVTVTFATNQLHLCEGGVVELPFTVTPPHARAQISFDTVDAQAPNLTNHLATAVPSPARPTNLIVTSLGAGTAVIRARLGASVFPGA